MCTYIFLLCRVWSLLSSEISSRVGRNFLTSRANQIQVESVWFYRILFYLQLAWSRSAGRSFLNSTGLVTKYFKCAWQSLCRYLRCWNRWRSHRIMQLGSCLLWDGADTMRLCRCFLFAFPKFFAFCHQPTTTHDRTVVIATKPVLADTMRPLLSRFSIPISHLHVVTHIVSFLFIKNLQRYGNSPSPNLSHLEFKTKSLTFATMSARK